MTEEQYNCHSDARREAGEDDEIKQSQVQQSQNTMEQHGDYDNASIVLNENATNNAIVPIQEEVAVAVEITACTAETVSMRDLYEYPSTMDSNIVVAELVVEGGAGTDSEQQGQIEDVNEEEELTLFRLCCYVCGPMVCCLICTWIIASLLLFTFLVD